MFGPVLGATRHDSNGICCEPPDIPADMRCHNLKRTNDRHNVINIWKTPTTDLLPTYQGFIAQLVEQRTGIADVMGSNPAKALKFYFR